jgi:hypothetical protein
MKDLIAIELVDDALFITHEVACLERSPWDEEESV